MKIFVGGLKVHNEAVRQCEEDESAQPLLSVSLPRCESLVGRESYLASGAAGVLGAAGPAGAGSWLGASGALLVGPLLVGAGVPVSMIELCAR